MTAAQQLENAIALLRGRHGSLEDLGEDCVAGARASALVVDAIYDGRIKTRPLHPTTDAAPRGGRHIHIHLPTNDDNGGAIEAGERSGVVGAQAANGRAGARLVQVLEGDATAYFVANDGRGRACLYRTVETNGTMDPGAVSPETKTLTGDQARRIRAGDADRSRRVLAEINRRNQAAWAGR
jgi:hypothetical protein